MVLLSAVRDDEREGRGAGYLASSEAACWAGLSEYRVKLALWNGTRSMLKAHTTYLPPSQITSNRAKQRYLYV
jgi:hypothetical protein